MPSYGGGASGFGAAVSGYGASAVAQVPRVHGVSHTVKQVNVFDSHPGALGSVSGQPGGQGYQVTEAEEDEDAFTAVNSLHQSYPGTFNFVRGVAPANHDPFAEATPLAGEIQTHDPFSSAVQPTSALSSDTFTGSVQTETFSSSAPTQGEFSSVQPSPEFPVTFQGDTGDFGSTADTFVGSTGGTAFAADENKVTDDGPVSFTRVGGIQQLVKTGGVETLVY